MFINHQFGIYLDRRKLFVLTQWNVIVNRYFKIFINYKNKKKEKKKND